MNRESIYREIIDVAERFGSINPQELKRLSSQLQRLPSEEVLAGLLLVFIRSRANEPNYLRQEYAGRLLAKLNPSAQVDLEKTIPVLLPGYNPSIEQLPEYLAARCGKDAVIQALLRYESEGIESRAKGAARTMRWWLGDVSDQ